jgi:hypothetical protein
MTTITTSTKRRPRSTGRKKRGAGEPKVRRPSQPRCCILLLEHGRLSPEAELRFKMMLWNSRRRFPAARARFVPVACCTLAGLLTPLGPLPARADVEVQGTSASVHVIARNAKVSEVLRALTETLKRFHCKETTDLDNVISGSYEGSVQDVLGRILRGYDYIITTEGTATDILVVGKSAGAPAIVPGSGPVAPVSGDPASATVARLPPAFAAPLPIGRAPVPTRGRR